MVYLSGVKRSVETLETYFNEVAETDHASVPLARKKLNRDNLRRLPVAGGNEIEARIDHSRWICDCPNCGSAEFYSEDKLFMCSVCGNSNVEGKTMKVKLPKERKQIEDLLKDRPIKNRNWSPGETLKNLEKENKDKQ